MNIPLRRYFLVFTILFSCVTNGKNPDLPKLKVVTEIIAPFQLQNDNGELTGFSVEIIQALFDEIDLQPNIIVMPWARAYDVAKNEPNVLIFSIARTPHREPMFHWIGNITHETFSFWGERSKFTDKQYNQSCIDSL